MKSKPVFALLLFFLFACNSATNNDTSPADTAASAPKSPVTKTVFDVAPELRTADSLQVLFYDNPDGDSLRYSRYFTYTETADTMQINSLLKEMEQVYVQEPRVRSCRSEGKLYLLSGEDVLKTVYFSTRGDSCRYFYFIKDGAFFYLPVTERAAAWLKENKQKARKITN